MQRLYVLYDADCGVCGTARQWCEQQYQTIPLRFVAANGSEALRLFPALARPGQRPEELVVVADDGAVYREGHAWIMVLFALAEYRELSFRLASPSLLPLARSAFHFLSQHRAGVSALLGLRSDRDLAARLAPENTITCAPPEPTLPAPAPAPSPGPRPSLAHPELHDGWTN